MFTLALIATVLYLGLAIGGVGAAMMLVLFGDLIVAILVIVHIIKKHFDE